ncbi:MAG TPA: ligase-associated DNA damage response endonuclease PdeM [Dongiaceae bacterium]|nr:ligase-associated DNA damage response endonuclease PdeM [Dongiaceae bacterium]
MPLEVLFGDALLHLDPSGAIYWPEQQLLAVADLHFEKGSSFAASAHRMLPPHDTTQTLADLGRAIDLYRPRRVICLGDSFHDRAAATRLSLGDLAEVQRLAANRDWVWIAGNHDPVLPDIVGGIAASSITVAGLTFRHDAADDGDPSPGNIVFGHFHPVALVSLAGRLLRRRCFLLGSQRLLMPAFGAYAGGLNILHPAICDLFPAGFRVLLSERGRLHPINVRHLRPDTDLSMSHKFPGP